MEIGREVAIRIPPIGDFNQHTVQPPVRRRDVRDLPCCIKVMALFCACIGGCVGICSTASWSWCNDDQPPGLLQAGADGFTHFYDGTLENCGY